MKKLLFSLSFGLLIVGLLCVLQQPHAKFFKIGANAQLLSTGAGPKPAVAGTPSIAFVAAFDGGNSGGSSTQFSYNYNVTGGNSQGMLVAAIVGDTTSDNVTTVFYNSVGMTNAVKKQVTSQRWTYLYYLLNPSTGTNSLQINCSPACNFILSGAAHYTGVATSSAVDTTNTGNSGAAATTLTTSVTTTVDKDWTVLVEQSYDNIGDNLPPSAGAGLTRRTFDAALGTWGLFDSAADITPAGVYSMTTTRSSASTTIGHVVAAFKP